MSETKGSELKYDLESFKNDAFLDGLVETMLTAETNQDIERAANNLLIKVETLDKEIGGRSYTSKLVSHLVKCGFIPNISYDFDGTGKLSEKNLEYCLDMLNISVKYNTISHKCEITGEALKRYGEAVGTVVAPTLLRDVLQRQLKYCTNAHIEDFLTNISLKNSYNPVLDKLNSVEWDKKDWLSELYDIMHVSAPIHKIFIKKWLMQAYCGLHNTVNNPFSLDMVLVLVGNQGCGKTSIFRKLALNSLFFGEGTSYDPKDKDTLIQCTSKWIVEFGEIGSTMKKDINKVKAFISNTIDEYRPPYGKTTLTFPRITSLCGTTNDVAFLVDETGNRRFLTVPLPPDEVIAVGSEKFRNFNALQLWKQIESIVEAEMKRLNCSYGEVFRLDENEKKILAIENKKHEKPLFGEEEVVDALEISGSIDGDIFVEKQLMTLTEFKEMHNLRNLSNAQIGKILQKYGYEKQRESKPGCRSRQWVYELPCKKTTYTGISYSRKINEY